MSGEQPAAPSRDLIVEDIVARTGIDEAMIERLVRSFYAAPALDPLLGPVFDGQVAGWEPHLARMCAFWSSVALMSGRYHGQPMVAHLPLPVDTPHFDRWLEIFAATARRDLPAGGGRAFPRARPSDRRQPGAGHRGTARGHQGEACTTEANLGAGHSGDALNGMPPIDFSNELRLMDLDSSTAITHPDDGFVVDAELVAKKLGLAPDAFWREMQRGIIYGVVEWGEGDDAGRVQTHLPLSRPELDRDAGGCGTMTNKSDDDPAVEVSSPACLMHEADDAYMGFAGRDEVHAFLNGLLEAERADPVTLETARAADTEANISLASEVATRAR